MQTGACVDADGFFAHFFREYLQSNLYVVAETVSLGVIVVLTANCDHRRAVAQRDRLSQ